jgi:1-deoxy-D-xylulose-5-phosphate reductoisomerase
MKQLAVIGSTGSIGQNTLRVVRTLSDRFKVFALGAHRSIGQLAAQIRDVGPQVVAVADDATRDELRTLCVQQGITVPEIVTGAAGLRGIASANEVDIVVSGAVGAAGLAPTWAAVEAGKTVALANKESMVLAGERLRAIAIEKDARIIPVDSEHSAIDQCLRSGRPHEVKRLILTASGGPFRETPLDRMDSVTPADALNHPTWRMGPRITIDSATMMNKGLEVIEARWLFGVASERIDIIVHPQSIVHSMVEFRDGSVVAQLGMTDMRQPIQYALTYPERLESCVPSLDWSQASRLEFIPLDPARFPCVRLAYRALERGGTAPAVLNAADEVAVEAFLQGHIRFTDILRTIEETMEAYPGGSGATLESVMAADSWARDYAGAQVSHARMTKS